MASALDNPLWASLTDYHRALAVGGGDLLRYPPEVAPFLAVPRAGALDPAALERLVRSDETVLLVGPEVTAGGGWEVTSLGAILQMVCDAPVPAIAGPVQPLTEAERPAVLALTALVYPHYFRPRTMDLGRYFGVVEAGALQAMIGERMAPPGYREISAVCTHPDFLGKGLARRLLAHLSNDIFAGGKTPFLHVSPDNTRAVQLYEQTGFRTRIAMPFWALRKRA